MKFHGVESSASKRRQALGRKEGGPYRKQKPFVANMLLDSEQLVTMLDCATDEPPPAPAATDDEDPVFNALARKIDRGGRGVCDIQDLISFFEACFGSGPDGLHPLVREQILGNFITDVRMMVSCEGRYRSDKFSRRYVAIALRAAFRGEGMELCRAAKVYGLAAPRNCDRTERRWAPVMHLLLHCKMYRPLCWAIAATAEPAGSDGVTHNGTFSAEDLDKFCHEYVLQAHGIDSSMITDKKEKRQLSIGWASKHGLQFDPNGSTTVNALADALERAYLEDLRGLLSLAEHTNVEIDTLMRRVEKRNSASGSTVQVDERVMQLAESLDSDCDGRILPKDMVQCCRTMLECVPGALPSDKLQLPILLTRMCNLSLADVNGCNVIRLARAIDALLGGFDATAIDLCLAAVFTAKQR
jgi:hypothetical protein